MENALEFVKYGVAVLITVVLVSYVVTVSNVGTDLFVMGSSQVDDVAGSVTNFMENTYYNGKAVKGAEVIDAIKYYYESNLIMYDDDGDEIVDTFANTGEVEVYVQTVGYRENAQHACEHPKVEVSTNSIIGYEHNPTSILSKNNGYFMMGKYDYTNSTDAEIMYKVAYTKDSSIYDQNCACYINPEATFICQQITEDSGVITGFRFTQE